ncbi:MULTISPECIES: RidA family protein [Methylobacterium]|jgi:2-iminobutanoate/2-iminopropanoate deaminase|uniref:RidA family protein n=1 Tax=Methylobacterium TaxID=407 RepID=UPI0008E0F641|nr:MULTISPECIES: RidA family protein [Methylobacterium]MBZ6413713.1 RidA family protein [Methylobacterium sp.]MBK3397520.1 RidA family protein [Methylobacterium ajmalii]MBK3409241.1 RidA family protein [Methylobacterium ajmalii]MBK3425547.1 RidA family protein [Methylobacterium ajmalii]SFF40797.1 reactive intermediate/imine deaminase [Methylobacterium sp. yr596]
MTDPITRLATRDAAAPAGHYSQGAAWGDLVFVSGQLGARPDGSHTSDQPFEVQARQALASLLAILAEAGSGPERILRVTAYVVGVAHWPEFNRIYAEVMGGAKPARTVVPVPELHHGYLVEVEAIAVRGG